MPDISELAGNYWFAGIRLDQCVYVCVCLFSNIGLLQVFLSRFCDSIPECDFLVIGIQLKNIGMPQHLARPIAKRIKLHNAFITLT